MIIFRTKLVNDVLYNRNGEEVEILDCKQNDNNFVTIKFKKDGAVATVYKSEVVTK